MSCKSNPTVLTVHEATVIPPGAMALMFVPGRHESFELIAPQGAPDILATLFLEFQRLLRVVGRNNWHALASGLQEMASDIPPCACPDCQSAERDYLDTRARIRAASIAAAARAAQPN